MVDVAVKGYWPRVLKKQFFFILGIVLSINLPIYWVFLFVLIAFIYRLRLSMGLLVSAWLCTFSVQLLLFPKPIETQLLNRDVTLIGSVIEIKKLKPMTFVFDVYKINNKSYYTRVLLTNYHLPGNILINEQLQIKAKIKLFSRFYNEGSRDYRKLMWFKRIQAKGYIKDYHRLGIEQGGYFSNTRQHLLKHLRALSLNIKVQGLIESLTLGVREHLSRNWKEVFRQTGTGHLIAISGLHVGIVAYLIYKLTFYLWRQSAYLCQRIAAQRVSALLAILSAFMYAGITGFSVSALRAFLMVSAVMVATLLKRKSYHWDSFMLALILVLLLNPYSIYSYGFYLSFYAVFIIFHFLDNKPGQIFRIQIAISTLMIPLSLYLFDYASFVSFPANFIAIPIVSFCVLPVSFLVLFFSSCYQPLALWLSHWLSYVVYCLYDILYVLKTLTWARLPFVIANTYQFVCLSILLWMVLKKRLKQSVYLSIFLAIPIFLFTPSIPTKALKITVLDVGQGLSVLLQTRNHVLIYDTARAFSSGFSFASSVISPYLHHQGVQRLDTIVISHDDIDHSGGLQNLVKRYPVGQIIKNSKTQVASCHHTKSWRWDGVDFQFLSLPKLDKSDNNHSCVLKVTVGSHHILLPGDIERKAEHFLVRNYKQQLRSDILIVPHHGSNTSSTLSFLNAVSPTYAVISAGRNNRFHFPHKKVVSRYQKMKTKVLNTAKNGQITWLILAKTPLGKPSLFISN